jgi:hypothetical protein
MSLHFIGQRFRVSGGGCWQCLPDCRSRLAEDLTFSSDGVQLVDIPTSIQQTTTNDSPTGDCELLCVIVVYIRGREVSDLNFSESSQR